MILIECQHEGAHSALASGVLEAFLLPILLLRPIECPDCSQRWYTPFFWKSLRIHPAWLLGLLLVLAVLSVCLVVSYLMIR